MSGPLRKKIGLAKGNINKLISDTKLQIEEDILLNLTLDEYDLKESTFIQIQSKLERHIRTLEKLEEKFVDILGTLNDKDPEHASYKASSEGPNGHITIAEEANELLDKLKGQLALIQSKIDEHHMKANAATTSTSALPGGPCNVRLPKVELPTFSGESTSEWMDFWEHFNNVVHTQG